jgi:cytochrome P450
VTIGTDPLSFGIGRHACPCRGFAANEIKLIAINILRQFDVEQKEKGPRYANIAYRINHSADFPRDLIIKKVKV